MENFNYNGHHYKVVKVENSTDCIIIRDGRNTRRVKKEIADNAIEYVDQLFMDYKKYSEELETIIAAINLPEHTRILVDGLVKQAKERSEK